MGFKHSATVAASIGFAVCAIAGCGSSGKLLSASQASALSDQLQRISEAVNDGDCTAAENDLTSFEDRVSSLSGVNSTLVNNLNQGANTIETLTQTKCTVVATTTTRTKTKKKQTNTTTTDTNTDTDTDTNTVTTPTDTDTVNTNTYTTQTYTAPYTDTQTSTTGGSGLGVPTETLTTTTTETTPTTSTTDTTDTTDTTGGTGYGDSSTTVGSATRYDNSVQYGHRHHGWWGRGF